MPVGGVLREKLRAEGWVSVTEAVHRFGLSHSTLYRLAKNKVVPSKRVGGVRLHYATGRGGGTLFVETKALLLLQKGAPLS